VGATHVIVEHVRTTDQIAENAETDARQSGETVTVLNNSVARIGSVIELIRSVASQTDLLALNATIEAARAGEAGRGFSAVAAEVKALAEQTARATDEIASHIQAIQAATHAAVGSMQAFSGRIGEIKTSTTAITAAVQQQRSATEGMTVTIRDAVERAQSANGQVNEVVQSVDGTRGAAGEVASSSEAVSRNAEALQSLVHTFLDELWAA
jgi:methyl-accepting chemotaxis protein